MHGMRDSRSSVQFQNIHRWKFNGAWPGDCVQLSAARAVWGTGGQNTASPSPVPEWDPRQEPGEMAQHRVALELEAESGTMVAVGWSHTQSGCPILLLHGKTTNGINGESYCIFMERSCGDGNAAGRRGKLTITPVQKKKIMSEAVLQHKRRQGRQLKEESKNRSLQGILFRFNNPSPRNWRTVKCLSTALQRKPDDQIKWKKKETIQPPGRTRACHLGVNARSIDLPRKNATVSTAGRKSVKQQCRQNCWERGRESSMFVAVKQR